MPIIEKFKKRWPLKMSPDLGAVPADHVISHATVHPWVKGVILCKIMDRVSICHLLSFPPMSDKTLKAS